MDFEESAFIITPRKFEPLINQIAQSFGQLHKVGQLYKVMIDISNPHY